MIEKFWRNAKTIGISEIILKSKAIIMMPLVTKYFGTIDYGIWSQVTIIIALFSPLVFLGSENALCLFLPGKPIKEQQKIFSGWIIFGFITSLIIGLLVIEFHKVIAEFANHGFRANVYNLIL